MATGAILKCVCLQCKDLCQTILSLVNAFGFLGIILILEYLIESLIWIASNGTWEVIQYVSSPLAVLMLRGTREMLTQYPIQYNIGN